MKYRLLELLCCPACGGQVSLDRVREGQALSPLPVLAATGCRDYCGRHQRPAQGSEVSDCRACYGCEIEEGWLTCDRCQACYPVVEGIPRLLRRPLLDETLGRYHPEFLERRQECLDGLAALSSKDSRKVSTLHAFSYQWTTFLDNYDYFRDIFLSFVAPFLGPDDFHARLVLDVGCGSGRPASVAASLGAEVVAVDLSEAVQSAHAVSRHYPRLHVIQADAYALPVRAAFDVVYSVGVLQHLPDPAGALQRIAAVVPSGQPLVLWVYGVRAAWYQPIEWLRRLTVPLPYRMLHVLAVLLAALSELLLLIPYRRLVRYQCTRGFAERIPGRIYARFPFRENVIGWFDRLGAPVTHYFTREQVTEMLRQAGLIEIEVVPRPGASASWVARGMAP